MITQQHREECQSRAYIQAVIAKAGMIFADYNIDYGIDLTLRTVQKTKTGKRVPAGMPLDIQLKSSIKATLQDDGVHYALEIDTFDYLREDEENSCPRILVLLHLPREEEEWMHHNEDNLLIRKCAYWISLKGFKPVERSNSFTITIPRSNQFTVEALQEIMNKIKKGYTI